MAWTVARNGVSNAQNTWLGLGYDCCWVRGGSSPFRGAGEAAAEARHFVIQSTGGKHGDSWTWIAPDGARMGRESMNLRGQVFELDSSGKAGADGLPSSVMIRGVNPQGTLPKFQRHRWAASWKSPVDAGNGGVLRAGVLRLAGRPDRHHRLVPRVAAREPDKSLDLLPGGKARAARLTTLRLAPAGPPRSRCGRLPASALRRCPIWADANNKFFAITFGIAWLPEAYAGEQAKIEAAQAAAMAEQAPGLAKRS